MNGSGGRLGGEGRELALLRQGELAAVKPVKSQYSEERDANDEPGFHGQRFTIPMQ